MKHEIPNNFGGLTREFSHYESAQVVILPVPFDGTSSWGKGADRGPEALLHASQHMELYDIESQSEVYKNGIHTARAVTAETPDRMIDRVYRAVQRFLRDDKFVVTIGGEHSISSAPVRAYAEKYPNLSVLQLDAHSDMRDTFEGSKYNHACVMARIKEIVKTIVAVGIRSHDTSELENLKAETIFWAHEIWRDNSWMRKAVTTLKDDVYVTIDLDVFDSSIMSSTGTPEPGGMNWYQVMELLALVVSGKRVVGFDVVELCPMPPNRAPDFLAAKLVYRFLSMIFANQNKQVKRKRARA